MEKSIKITLIISATIIFVALIGIYTIFQLNPITSNVISVKGDATIKVVPDLITVYFDIQSKGTTAKEAEDKNSEIVNKLINDLVNKGFDEKDIKTQNFNVYPNYVWDGRTQSTNGYIASHSLKIELSTESTNKVGEVIDSGVESGASISYINFELQEATENLYKAEALKLATTDAKIKAEAIAEGLGKKVGKIVSVSDSSFNYSPWEVYAKAEGGVSSDSASAQEARVATTNIQPSEQEIYAQVSVSYRLS